MKIQLYDYQKTHLNEIKGILENHPYAFDFSMLGTGKTFTSAKLSEALGLDNIIVIAPVSVKTKWLQVKEMYDIPLKECISFCELRSVKCKQPKHGLLHRHDYQTTHTVYLDNNVVSVPIDKVSFKPTAKFKKYVEDGCLLIIDEIQNIKNKSSQFLACSALIQCIVKTEGTKSKVLLVSGSPIDKKEQVAHLLRAIGALTHDSLCEYNIGTRMYDYSGYFDVEQFCLKFGNLPLNLGRHQNIYDCNRNVYRMFQEVIKPALSRAMDPVASSVSLNKYNGYFTVQDPKDRMLLATACDALSRACQFNQDTNQVRLTNAVLSAISLFLMQIETAKIKTLARIAREKLVAIPNCKVVICVNYSSSIKDLVKALADFSPLVLNGSTTVKARTKVISQFQEHNANHRILIANLTVCSTGIDLDDKHGEYPRVVFVSPMYNTITLYQLCHRFQRMDTKSSSDIYMVYAKNMIEKRIITALSLKSQVMKETTEKQANAGIQFPGDYPDFIEPTQST